MIHPRQQSEHCPSVTISRPVIRADGESKRATIHPESSNKSLAFIVQEWSIHVNNRSIVPDSLMDATVKQDNTSEQLWYISLLAIALQ